MVSYAVPGVDQAAPVPMVFCVVGLTFSFILCWACWWVSLLAQSLCQLCGCLLPFFLASHNIQLLTFMFTTRELDLACSVVCSTQRAAPVAAFSWWVVVVVDESGVLVWGVICLLTIHPVKVLA